MPQNPNPHSTLWEARPAANAATGLPEPQSFAPRSGLPQKSTTDGHAAKPKPSLNPVGGAPRGECRPQACHPSKLRPEAGPPTKKHRRRAYRKTQTLTKPRGRRAPAANAGHRPARTPKLRPEVGPPTKKHRRWACRKTQTLTQPRGRRAPRRTQACRRCRNRLESRSFRSTKAR